MATGKLHGLVVREGAAPVRDRLVTMIVLTALLHGLVILGVTFGPLSGNSAPAPSLEVVIVSDELPEAKANDPAIYLAQRTQLGSGNTREARAARLGSRRSPVDALQPPPRAALAPPEPLLATTGPSARMTYLSPPAEITPPEPIAERPPSRPDEDVELRGPQRDELWISADTRASVLAPYLDAWKGRVERIGTVNYPSAAQRRGLKGNPVLEVAIAADGALHTARIRRSSGHPEIDAAALDILKLASPFEPFPPEIAARYRVLRFAYEWQFVGGTLAEGRVTVP